MKRPIPGLVGHKLERAHGANRHVDRDLRPLGIRWNPPAIGASHAEVKAMEMNGMVGHGEVTHSDPHTVVPGDSQVIDAGKCAAIERPRAEVRHGADLRRVASRIDVVGVNQKYEVAVYAVL